MMRATIDRVTDLGSSLNPIIVTNASHADAISREMLTAGYLDAVLVLEPVGRNTAPAVAVAAHEAASNGDPLMLVLPSDHTISNTAAFQDAVGIAAQSADAGYLVTFGITPSRPETGYGYIKLGEEIGDGVSRVTEFKEKPDTLIAREYVESGEYLWNSGMFLIRASRYLEELAMYAPDIAEATAAAYGSAIREGNRLHLDEANFTMCRSDSIDYAVMERTSMAAVVPTDPGWNDIGSWESLWEIADKDGDGNVLTGDVVTASTSGSYVRSSSRLVATVGVEDLIIVETRDALLVARRDVAQDVKEIVDKLKAQNREELESNGTVRADWGESQTINASPGFHLLHLWIDPGATATMHGHTHRSKHWLVVKGEARISSGGESRLVPEGQSVYIAPQIVHNIENLGDDVVEVIEVNIGASREGSREREYQA